MYSKTKVKQWMISELQQKGFIDPKTDEPDRTGVGEGAADRFQIYDIGGNIPEWVFEMSHDVACAFDPE